MRIFFLMGLALLVAAFFSGAAEIASRVVSGQDGFTLSAREVWYTLSPGSLIVFEIKAGKVLPPFLSGAVLPFLLSFPAWALFGLPGGLLAWRFHPKRSGKKHDGPEDDLFLIDRLAAQAREDGYDDDDDMDLSLPPHAGENGERDR